MKCHYAYLICAFCLAGATSTSADIVWSGELYQRTYHDITSIDMNQDGTIDFTLNRTIPFENYQYYYITPVDGQVVVEQWPHSVDPILLAEGTHISSSMSNPDLVWQGTETLLFYYTGLGNLGYGGLVNGDGYLGVSFEVEGATHYGWLKASHNIFRPSPDDQFLYIHGWAYESTPDTGIIAGAVPEPSTGILTMVGSLSLLLLTRSRRRRQAGRAPLPRCRTPHTSTTPENW